MDAFIPAIVALFGFFAATTIAWDGRTSSGGNG